MVEQRLKKIASPDMLKAKGEIKSPTGLVGMLVGQRNTWKSALLTDKIIIDNRVHKHPFLGEMTIYDWINFTIYHTQRHIEQMKEIINK